MKQITKQPRSRKTGQYDFDGNFDRMCKCGHTLGKHFAESPRPCVHSEDSSEGINCDCSKFKAVRKSKV